MRPGHHSTGAVLLCALIAGTNANALDAQEAERQRPHLYAGDSVRVELFWDEGVTAYTGVVLAPKNTRDCIFIRIVAMDGPRYFSFGRFLDDDFVLYRYWSYLMPAAESEEFTADYLRGQGIVCIEGHTNPPASEITP